MKKEYIDIAHPVAGGMLFILLFIFYKISNRLINYYYTEKSLRRLYQKFEQDAVSWRIKNPYAGKYHEEYAEHRKNAAIAYHAYVSFLLRNKIMTISDISANEVLGKYMAIGKDLPDNFSSDYFTTLIHLLKYTEPVISSSLYQEIFP
jgi:hypothetical protein